MSRGGHIITTVCYASGVQRLNAMTPLRMGSWITRAVPCAAAKDVGNLDSIEKREGKSQVFKVETGQSSLGFRPVNLLYSCLSREFRNNNTVNN